MTNWILKQNMFLWAGLIYVALITGMAIADVGRIRDCTQGTYGWDLPIGIFMLLAMPVALGYAAGLWEGYSNFQDAMNE